MMNSGHGGTSDEQRTGRNGSRVRQDVPETAVGLLRALRNTSVSVLYQDADLRVTWAQNVPSAWSPSSIVGMVDGDFLPPQAAGPVVAAKRAILSGSPADRLEICIPGLAGEREDQWYDLWV